MCGIKPLKRRFRFVYRNSVIDHSLVSVLAAVMAYISASCNLKEQELYTSILKPFR